MALKKAITASFPPPPSTIRFTVYPLGWPDRCSSQSEVIHIRLGLEPENTDLLLRLLYNIRLQYGPDRQGVLIAARRSFNIQVCYGQLHLVALGDPRFHILRSLEGKAGILRGLDLSRYFKLRVGQPQALTR